MYFFITLYKIAITINSNEAIIFCITRKGNHIAFQAMLNVFNTGADEGSRQGEQLPPSAAPLPPPILPP